MTGEVWRPDGVRVGQYGQRSTDCLGRTSPASVARPPPRSGIGVRVTPRLTTNPRLSPELSPTPGLRTWDAPGGVSTGVDGTRGTSCPRPSVPPPGRGGKKHLDGREPLGQESRDHPSRCGVRESDVHR